MVILNLFSKQKKLEQGGDDVYQYDILPKKLRVQVAHILKDALGQGDRSLQARYHRPTQWWAHIHDMLAREKGVFRLSESEIDPFHACMSYVLNADTDDVLDLIQVALNYLQAAVDLRELQALNLTHPNEIIAELNGRFRENAVGYFYANGRIGRIDSQFIHKEVVLPALCLLRDQGKAFTGPSQEFLAAHDFHRKGKGHEKDAIGNALKAFESTLKAICDARRWPYDRNKDAAKALLDIVFAKKLVPDYLQTAFAGIRSILEGGVPTVSNRTSRHGQGATPTDVPDWLVAYVLHVTAANIVMLVEAHKAMP